jgi:membrane protein YdbS with pleckstrin-like domain
MNDQAPNPTPESSDEQPVWKGSPSQIIHLPLYLLCGLAAGALVGAAVLLGKQMGASAWAVAGAALVPLVVAAAKWLQTRCRRYELTSQRLLLSEGVLSRRTDQVELYRVKDYTLVEPLSLRLFGLGNITVTTTDDANLTIVLQAVPEAQALRDQLRKHVETCRDRKRVRVSEFE